MKQKILVIEDDDSLGSCYFNVLQERYDVALVASGEDALGYIRSHSGELNLVLLDYRLPDYSGIEILKKIKVLVPSVPIIMTTGYGSEDVAVTAFRCGANDYLRKPFSGSQLLALAEMHIHFENAGPEQRVQIHPGRRAGEYARNSGGGDHNFRIQKVIRFIEDHYETRISLDSAARKACMSKYHFSRVFKKVTSTTFQDFVNMRRISRSRELLNGSTLSITEIGFAVGYGDLTHFGRTFRRLVGCTPSEYRKVGNDTGEAVMAKDYTTASSAD